MKKILLPLLLAALCVGTAQAQLHSRSNAFAGLKVGGSAASFIGADDHLQRYLPGFNAGVFFSLPLARPFSVQPELLYSMKGSKGPAAVSDASTWLNYVDIPVAFRATTETGFFAEAGPQVGFLVTAKSDATGEKINVKDDFSTIDFGYLVGVGYQPFKGGLGIGARFNAGLISAYKAANGVEEPDLRNSAFQVYLTYSRSKVHKLQKRTVK